VGIDTLIPTGGALGESLDGHELSSLSWKSRVGGDPKVESCLNVGNGTSIPIGGELGELSDAYDEPSVSWNFSLEKQWGHWGEAIRR
jgi:hypothetical protein